MTRKMIMAALAACFALTGCGGETEKSSTSMLDPSALGVNPSFSDDRKTITYGLYPQTHVSDKALISSLNKLQTRESNGWYLYDGSYYEKKYVTAYADSFEFSDGTHIGKGTEHWFKCEPIEWKVLSSLEGTYSLVSSVILDARCYHSTTEDRTIDDETIYANNYEHSDIRKWLIDDFYKSAFALGDSLIQTVIVDNSVSTLESQTDKCVCDDTEDKVYLLSYADYNNTDYFADEAARGCETTDWVRASNVYYSLDPSYLGNCNYWTRSPYYFDSNHSYYANYVNYFGKIEWKGFVDQSYSYYGVRPGLTIKIEQA